MRELTKPQLRFLLAVATARLDLHRIAFRVGQRPSSVSKTRNALLSLGMIEDWDDYADPIRITAAGRRAIEGDGDE